MSALQSPVSRHDGHARGLSRKRRGLRNPVGAAFLKLPRETLAVGARLFRAAAAGNVSGEDRVVPPFEAARCPLHGDDPAATSAQAILVLAASLTPDAYLLRLEPERGRVLVHAILPDRGAAR